MPQDLCHGCYKSLKDFVLVLGDCENFINKINRRFRLSRVLFANGINDEYQYLRFRLGEVRSNLMFDILVSNSSRKASIPA